MTEAAKTETTEGTAKEPGQEMTIEASFARLKEILAAMEKEDATLEDSYRLYEEGMKLVRSCSEKIDRVEKKVQLLNQDGTTQDFT